MSVLAIVEQRMAGEVLAAAHEFGQDVKAYSIDLPYTADAYTAAVEELIRKVNPTLVVFGHTYQTRDYAPKLAARFGRVLIGDVIAGKPPVFVRPDVPRQIQRRRAPGWRRTALCLDPGRSLARGGLCPGRIIFSQCHDVAASS